MSDIEDAKRLLLLKKAQSIHSKSEPLDINEVQLEPMTAHRGAFYGIDANIARMKQTRPETLVLEEAQQVGSAGGTAIGAALGSLFGPGGAVVGGFTGTFLGGTGGRAIEEIREEPGQKPTAILKESLKGGTEELAWDVATLGLSEAARYGLTKTRAGKKILSKIYAPFKGTVIPGKVKANEALKEASKRMKIDDLAPDAQAYLKKHGTSLKPSQMTQGRGQLESIVEASAYGGAGERAEKQFLQPRAVEQIRDDVVELFWDELPQRMSSFDAGEEVISVLANKRKIWHEDFGKRLVGAKQKISPSQISGKAVADYTSRSAAKKEVGEKLYSAVDDAVKNIGSPVKAAPDPRVVTQAFTNEGIPTDKIVDLEEMQNIAKKWIDFGRKNVNLGSSGSTKNFAEAVAQYGTKGSFQDAHDLRSLVLEELRRFDDITGPKRSITAKNEVQKAIKDAMYNAADKYDPSVRGLLDEADTFWATYRGTYNNPIADKMVKLAENGTDDLERFIFQNGATDNMVVAKEVFGEDTFNQMRDNWALDSIELALKDKKNIGTAFKTKLKRMGTDALAVMYTPDDMATLYKVADTFEGVAANEMQNTMYNKVLGLADKDADKVSSFIFRKGNLENVKQAKRHLPKKTYDTLVAAKFDDLLTNAINRTDQANIVLIDWKAVDNELRKLGPEVVENMMSPAAKKGLDKLISVASSQQVNSKGLQILTNMAQASGAATVLAASSMTDKALGAALIVAPNRIGHLLRSEKSLKWLTTGLQTPDDAKMLKYFGRAAREAARIGHISKRPPETTPLTRVGRNF